VTKIYEFPKAEDREIVEGAVATYITTPVDLLRDLMTEEISRVLERYHISKLFLRDYAVLMCEDIVIFEAMTPDDDGSCPACGSKTCSRRLLNIINNVEHYGCHCGALYYRKNMKVGNSI